MSSKWRGLAGTLGGTLWALLSQQLQSKFNPEVEEFPLSKGSGEVQKCLPVAEYTQMFYVICLQLQAVFFLCEIQAWLSGKVVQT